MSTNLSAGAANAYATFEAQSGNTYQADANGNVTGVALGDVTSLIHMGLLPALGMGIYKINLLDLAYTSAGTSIGASAATGTFGKTITPGTAAYLVSMPALSATITSVLQIYNNMSSTYLQGTPFSLAVNANYVLGSGTIGTHTINANLYILNDNGSMSADLIAVAAKPLLPGTNGNGTDVVFAGLSSPLVTPGCRYILQIQTVHQDTGASNIYSNINSARFY
jgi:hypothetical protein